MKSLRWITGVVHDRESQKYEPPVIVHAQHFIRKMRGGAQSHLIACDDSHYYVVKVRNNPQHRRILINENVTSSFLRYLGIATPKTAIVYISQDFLDHNPDVYLQLGSRRIPVETGLHFGSRYPGDPSNSVVYDFIPDTILHKVSNREHFLGVLVLDKWVGNADARQSIFFKNNPKGNIHTREDVGISLSFSAQMIDHGYAFDGPHWLFADTPLQGLYFRPKVYEMVRSLDDFQPWLDRVSHFPERIVTTAIQNLPAEWTAGDETALDTLVTKLLRRRARICELVCGARKGRINPFPNWR